jgi:Xaa-Pro dipeptidase
LHYGHASAPNDKKVQAGDMLLLDMGAEYHGYGSDITCSFPASGKFSPQQKIIYEMVLAAQKAVFAAIRPGIIWSEMHRVAEAVIGDHLIKHGFIIPGDKTRDQLIRELHLVALFFPHGLGHLMGLDVHDVGGYPAGEPARILEPGIQKLRTNRTLKPGMVLTVEPGVYFIEALLRPALADATTKRYLNVDKINEFMAFGGVRLEDDIVITANGCEVLTKVPREVADVEAVMAGAPWPPSSASSSSSSK